MSIYLSKNRYATINAFYSFQLEEFHMTEHAHDRCEIMYIADGSCKVWLDGQLIGINPKQFVFIDQNVPHQLLVEKGIPCTILNLEFSCSPDPKGIDLGYLAERVKSFQVFLDGHQDFLLLCDSENVYEYLRRLIEMLEKKQPDDQYLIELLLCQLLAGISRCTGSRKRHAGTLYIKKAKEYINSHYLEDISSDMIAEFVGINRSYLHTLFSRYVGCSIMTYTNNLRLDRATFLLKNTNTSITDIAFQSGFNSRQHFGYTFEKHFHTSPFQYRKLSGGLIKSDTETFIQSTL